MRFPVFDVQEFTVFGNVNYIKRRRTKKLVNHVIKIYKHKNIKYDKYINIHKYEKLMIKYLKFILT
jgi:hypothetical protein